MLGWSPNFSLAGVQTLVWLCLECYKPYSVWGPYVDLTTFKVFYGPQNR